jgi:hypothetical protein
LLGVPVGSLMIVPGYGFLDSLPGGVRPPISDWDGLRRIKISRLLEVVDDEWASWSLPSIVCYGDSGSPTFFTVYVLDQFKAASMTVITPDVNACRALVLAKVPKMFESEMGAGMFERIQAVK